MIFLIPARAGSKRLPGKNKRLFCGLPLWMWSWACAQRIKSRSDEVIVSSDDMDISRVTRWPLRAPELCEDDSPIRPLIDHYLKMDDVCLLQPTSPTRKDALVISMLERGDSCRSVTNGKPNGQCYVYRRFFPESTDVETEQGHDIDREEDFLAAEKAMMERIS